jgi:hypothetical protein
MSLTTILDNATPGAILVFLMLLVGVFLAGFCIGAVLGRPQSYGSPSWGSLKDASRAARREE